jgi:hypothetical protein
MKNIGVSKTLAHEKHRRPQMLAQEELPYCQAQQNVQQLTFLSGSADGLILFPDEVLILVRVDVK